MAQWDRLGSGDGDVEDRRTMRGAGGLVGGMSLGMVALVVGIQYFVFGQSPLTTLSQLASSSQSSVSSPTQQADGQYAGNDAYETFARKIVGSTSQTWTPRFQQIGATYKKPTLVLFRGATQSGCGAATSQVGPHYCPADGKIYLDETFFDELKALGGNNSDVAQAYVIAHEVGHHVQNQLDQLNSSTNKQSVKVELQADCYAGVWAHDVQGKGVFEVGDIDKVLQSAAAVGDDSIQKKTQGRVQPESWTHGSSEQRKAAFLKGSNAGTLQACSQ